jgi:hypothetical protein
MSLKELVFREDNYLQNWLSFRVELPSYQAGLQKHMDIMIFIQMPLEN